jgi:hypothetical protein
MKLTLLFYVTFVFLFIIFMLVLLLLLNLMNIFIVVNCFNMNVLHTIFIIKGQLLYFLIYFFMNLFI